jgi:hypothetical protein
MNLDLRIPMGLMFLLVGLILTIYGMVTMGSPIYTHSMGMDVNLDWGIVLLAFGAIMFTLGRRNQRRLDKELAKEPSKPQQPGTVRRGH